MGALGIVLSLILATVAGYPVTKPEYRQVQHGQSRSHIERRFDNTGNGVRSWTHHGVRHQVRHYVGTDSNWPEPEKVHVYISYRKTSGWREYHKRCRPRYVDTSIWHCSTKGS